MHGYEDLKPYSREWLFTTSNGSYMKCCLFTHHQKSSESKSWEMTKTLRDDEEGDEDEEDIEIEEEEE